MSRSRTEMPAGVGSCGNGHREVCNTFPGAETGQGHGLRQTGPTSPHEGHRVLFLGSDVAQ